MLFAGVNLEDVQFRVAWENPGQTGPGSAIVIDGQLTLEPVAVGEFRLRVEARAPCGVVGRATLTVDVIPSGMSCDMPSVVNPPEILRAAVGGGAVVLILFDVGGLFEGPFVSTSPASVSGGEPLVAASIHAGPPRQVRVLPGLIGGSTELVVTATDVCGRNMIAHVPVEVVVSPTCSPDYDPSEADYFPLSPGLRWRYQVRRIYSAPIGSSDRPGEETWEVVTESPCHGGWRSYEVDVQGTGSGVTGSMIFEVAGDSVRLVSRPSGNPDLFVGWTTRRFFPPTTPDTVVTDPYPGTPLGYSWRLHRDIGLTRFDYYVRCGAACSRSFSLQLLEGPSIVAAESQSVTQAYHRD
jgi:hypothetical protein